MKKLFVISVIALFVFGAMPSQASKEKRAARIERRALRMANNTEASYMSEQQFYADFGNIPDVQWRRSGSFDEATFIKDGRKITAFYDYDSKLVGTTTHVAFAELPVAAQKEINKKFKDYEIGQITYYQNNDANSTDMVLWNMQFDSQDNYFVELTKSNERIILQVNPRGEVFFFKQL